MSPMPKVESTPAGTESSKSEGHHKSLKRKRTKDREKRKRTLSLEQKIEADAVRGTASASEGGLQDTKRDDEEGGHNEKGEDEITGRSKGRREKRRRTELSRQNNVIKVTNNEVLGDNGISTQHTMNAADRENEMRKEGKKRLRKDERIKVESQGNAPDVGFATDSSAKVGTTTAKPESQIDQLVVEENLRGKGDIKRGKAEKRVVGKKEKLEEKRNRTTPYDQSNKVDAVGDEISNEIMINPEHIMNTNNNEVGIRRQGRKRKHEKRMVKAETKEFDTSGKIAMKSAPKNGIDTVKFVQEGGQFAVEHAESGKQTHREERVDGEETVHGAGSMQATGKYVSSGKKSKERAEIFGSGRLEGDATKKSEENFWKKLRKEGNRATAPPNYGQNKSLGGKIKTGDEQTRAKQSIAKVNNGMEKTKRDLTAAERGNNNDEGGDEKRASPVEKKDVDKEGSGNENDERLERTLFVGNVPLTATQKDIKKLFKPFGEVETVRIRGVTPENPRLPKKVALLTGRLAKFADSHHAYVVLKEDQDFKTVMKRATRQLNMSMYMDHHIRVMPAGSQKRKGYRSSLFVGNLPFDCEEEELVRAFSEPADKMGVEIVNVRVNRDKETGVGRGVGFVTFNDSLGIQGCINEAGHIKIRGRVVRMEAASKEKKLNAKTSKRKQRASRTQSAGAIYWHQARANFRTKKTKLHS